MRLVFCFLTVYFHSHSLIITVIATHSRVVPSLRSVHISSFLPQFSITTLLLFFIKSNLGTNLNYFTRSTAFGRIWRRSARDLSAIRSCWQAWLVDHHDGSWQCSKSSCWLRDPCDLVSKSHLWFQNVRRKVHQGHSCSEDCWSSIWKTWAIGPQVGPSPCRARVESHSDASSGAKRTPRRSTCAFEIWTQLARIQKSGQWNFQHHQIVWI